MNHRPMRSWALLIGLVLGLAACGGSDPSAPATDGAGDEPVASAPPQDSEPSTAPAASAATAEGDANTAVVWIGDERHEFSDVRCDILAPRYIQAGNYGGDPEVVIVLPPDGWESEGDTYDPPSITVTIGDPFAGGQHWVAGDAGVATVNPIPEGTNDMGSYTVPDGRPVSAIGTARFVDVAALDRGEETASVGGSFQVNCP